MFGTSLLSRRSQALAAGALLLGTTAMASAPAVTTTLAARPAATGTINIGSKNFGEEYVVADMYRLLLQKAGFNVPAYHDLATTPILQKALMRGDIDLYPEYTGTGYEQVLGITQGATKAQHVYQVVKQRYQRRFNLTWLAQSPMNDTNGVGVSQATASKYNLNTLSDLAKSAGKLTFAAAAECKDRADCLGGMKSVYGINFKNIKYVESAPVRYKGLKDGTYDVIEVFTTDGPIKPLGVKVLQDDKHIFPADHIAPVVRTATLRKYPQIRSALNRLAPMLTTPVMIQLNLQVVVNGKDPLAVARSFLSQHHMI